MRRINSIRIRDRFSRANGISSAKMMMVLALMVMSGCASEKNTQGRGDEADSEYVYICTGRSARVYHRNDNCSGLASCRADIERINVDQAEDMGRRPCRRCYR